MKSETRVKSKLRQALFRHYKVEMDQSLSICPESCVFNVQPKTDNDQGRPIGPRVCAHTFYAQNGETTYCDSSLDPVQAEVCPVFTARGTKEEMKAHLKDKFRGLKDLPRHEIAKQGYHDVAALLWVLVDEDENHSDHVEEGLAEPLPVASLPAPGPLDKARDFEIEIEDSEEESEDPVEIEIEDSEDPDEEDPVEEDPRFQGLQEYQGPLVTLADVISSWTLWKWKIWPWNWRSSA